MEVFESGRRFSKDLSGTRRCLEENCFLLFHLLLLSFFLFPSPNVLGRAEVEAG